MRPRSYLKSYSKKILQIHHLLPHRISTIKTKILDPYPSTDTKQRLLSFFWKRQAISKEWDAKLFGLNFILKHDSETTKKLYG